MRLLNQMIMINWITAKEYEDITYKKCNGVARIAFNRPEVRNAFRPKTTAELYDAFYDARKTLPLGSFCFRERDLLRKMGNGRFALEETKEPEGIRAM